MKYFKNLKIKVQLSIIAFVIIIIMVFSILSSYFKTAKVVEQKNNEYFTEMISQVNTTIASNCDVLNHLVQNISYSKVVQDYLNETDETAKYSEYIQLKDYISSLASMKDGIVDIALFGNSGSSFNINGDIANVFKYKDEIPKKQLFYYTGRKVIEINNSVRDCFIVGARIYSTTNFQSNNNEVGTLMIVIDVNSLLGYKREDSKRNDPDLYMLDRDGIVFFSKGASPKNGSSYYEDSSLKASNNVKVIETDGIKYNIQSGEIPDIGGKIIFKVPQSELLGGLEDIRKQQFLILFIAMLLLTFLFLLVINNIIQPLNQFMVFMDGIKSGKLKSLKKRINLQGYAEIIIMANGFNNMLDEIDDLTHRLLETNTRLYEAELVRTRAEMDYLRSQINPHFLYNTLESIMGIAIEAGNRKIFNMIKALAHIFKYSIKGSDMVELDEELNMIKSYLYIQKIRFEDRINVKFDIPESITKVQVPKMFLQPIVENAIYHGIEPKVGEGHLWIEGMVSENRITILVKDDGVGMDCDKLEHIRNGLLSKPDIKGDKFSSNRNIGFANVNKRIKLTYGNEYEMEINSHNGVGTEVIIKLPFRGSPNV